MTIILRSKSQLGFIACIKIYMNIIHHKICSVSAVSKSIKSVTISLVSMHHHEYYAQALNNIFFTVEDPNFQFQQHGEQLRSASWQHLH